MADLDHSAIQAPELQQALELMNEQERSELGPLLMCAGLHVRRAARNITQFYDDHLRPTGLRATQYSVLSALRMASNLPISQLALGLGVDRTTLTRNIDVLKKNGWVKVVSGEDQRERLVQLTRKGRALHNKARPLWEQAQHKLTSQLGDDRFLEFVKLLDAATQISRGDESSDG